MWPKSKNVLEVLRIFLFCSGGGASSQGLHSPGPGAPPLRQPPAHLHNLSLYYIYKL